MDPKTPLSSTGPAGFGVIAERFRRAGQPEKAIALCREGLEKFPEHLSARVTLGWSLLDMGEHQAAFDELQNVLKRAPDNLAAIRGLAELHERGIGVERDAFSDLDGPQDFDPIRPAVAETPRQTLPELEAHVEPVGDIDPVLPMLVEPEPAGELDPIVEPMLLAASEPDPNGDLDPIVEPDLTVDEMPTIESTHFAIEDVLEPAENDGMFDLSGLGLGAPERDADPAPAFAHDPVPAPISLFERAPLALRDDRDQERVEELHAWLDRIHARRAESMSQYVAG